MKPVFFSIVIPVYQAQDYLKPCLKSIQKQSFRNFEIIAVDDASTDKSLAILEKFAHKNPEIPFQLITHNRNLGLGAARNSGIAHARGKYVCLLDADDYWLPEKLEVVYKAIKSRPHYPFFYHSVNELPGLRRRSCYQVKKSEQLAIKYNPIVPSAVVMSTDLAKKYPHLEDKSFQGVEDLDLWFRLLDDGVKFFYIKKALTAYRPGVGMSARLEEHMDKVMHVYKKYLGPYYIRKALLQKYYEAGRSCHKSGQYAKALYYYRKSRKINFKTLIFMFLCLLKN